MGRQHDEPIEVRRGLVGDREGPAQFLWRGRLYGVCEVLDQWVETGAWWRSAAVSRVYGLAGDDPSDAVRTSVGPGPGPAAGSVAGSAVGPPMGSSAGPIGVAGLLDDEREVWRVEAAPGRTAPRGIFDLSFAWATGEWSLVRAHD